MVTAPSDGAIAMSGREMHNIKRILLQFGTESVARGNFGAAIPVSMFLLNATHGFKVLPIDLPRRPWPVAMVMLKNRTQPPMVQLFVRQLRELVRKIPYRGVG
jgi:DNA-binding transcriptional LysR family regulator